MLRVLGGPKRLCDGLTRRDLLQVGSLGVLGLGVQRAVSAETGTSVVSGGFGPAKACILLFLYRSPSPPHTFDPKPAAATENRGGSESVASRVPGLDVCELLPRLATVMDKVTVLRTVSPP